MEHEDTADGIPVHAQQNTPFGDEIQFGSRIDVCRQELIVTETNTTSKYCENYIIIVLTKIFYINNNNNHNLHYWHHCKCIFIANYLL